MKNVVIIHGKGETDQSFWLPYIKNHLVKIGSEVSIPNAFHLRGGKHFKLL